MALRLNICRKNINTKSCNKYTDKIMNKKLFQEYYVVYRKCWRSKYWAWKPQGSIYDTDEKSQKTLSLKGETQLCCPHRSPPVAPSRKIHYSWLRRMGHLWHQTCQQTHSVHSPHGRQSCSLQIKCTWVGSLKAKLLAGTWFLGSVKM